jgi:8-oxo-dGTP pyrophosphatase MutT (NUDIX family)
VTNPPLPAGRLAAGILLTASSTGRSLYMLRRDCRCWATPGGHVEAGETPFEAMVRELGEETGWTGEIKRLHFVRWMYRGYRLYFGEVEDEFVPRLNEEHTKYRWVGRRQKLPGPLHPGLQEARLLEACAKVTW